MGFVVLGASDAISIIQFVRRGTTVTETSARSDSEERERVVRPLEGIRVIECCSGIAGSMLGKLYVDAGAEVIKVETAEGDPLRRFSAGGPLPEGEDGALFRFLAAGKHSVVGRPSHDHVGALIATADLLIEGGDDPADLDSLRAESPHLVIVSLTPFGRSGPWVDRPASDITLQAESGGLQFRGPLGRQPVQAGGRITEFLGALFAGAPSLGAVLHARSGGEGTHLDLSLHDVMAIAGSNHLDLVHQLTGAPEVGAPVRILDTPGIEQASDGLVAFNCNAGHMMQMFMVLIGQSELMDDPKFLSLNERLAMGPEWQSMIDRWTSERTVAEVVDAAVGLRVPVAPCHDGASIVSDEQLLARDVFVTGSDGFVRPRPPYRINGDALTPASHVPAIGQHDEFIFEAHERLPFSASSSGTASRPLAGLRVLDLTSWWVGALTTQFLGRLGADVIHVEGPGNPDGMRLTGKIFATTEAWWEFGHMFAAVDTDRRGIAIDLASDEGREVLWKLIDQADFLVENFAPRVAESWGLTHEAVLARNPRIVYLRMPAFGLDGPWRDRPAFAQTIEPMSTMSSITGFADGLPISKGGLPDPVGGATGAWTAMVAHVERVRSERGVAAESVMLEAALNVSAQPMLEFLAGGVVMGRNGNRSPHAAPQGVYQTVDEGQWLAVSVTSDEQWLALARVLGGEELARDSRFALHDDRVVAHHELDALLAEWVGLRHGERAADELCSAGVPAGMCRDPRLLRHHPQYRARRTFETVTHPVLGPIEVPGMPYRAPGVEAWTNRSAPTFGQHTIEVLTEAGFDQETLHDLVQRDILSDRPRGL